MKKILVIIFVLGAIALNARAEETVNHGAHHPDSTKASATQKTDDGMNALQDGMKAIRSEKEPVKRRKMMMDHMQAMRGYMHSEGGMKSGGGMSTMMKSDAMVKVKELAGKVAAESNAKKQQKLVKENAALIADHLTHMGKMMGSGMGMMQGEGKGGTDRMGKMEMMMDQMLEHMEQMQDKNK